VCSQQPRKQTGRERFTAAVRNRRRHRKKVPFFERKPSIGKTIAVIGAGPAGLSCAHRLSSFGHRVTVFDKNEKAGGIERT
jgi:NADPH-dependent glutamate synthase beta subunit-like oxidoreductase